MVFTLSFLYTEFAKKIFNCLIHANPEYIHGYILFHDFSDSISGSWQPAELAQFKRASELKTRPKKYPHLDKKISN